jgi:hypothetical protein
MDIVAKADTMFFVASAEPVTGRPTPIPPTMLLQQVSSRFAAAASRPHAPFGADSPKSTSGNGGNPETRAKSMGWQTGKALAETSGN